jgi:hypothetical protein
MNGSADKLRPLAIAGSERTGRSRITPQRSQEHANAVASWVVTRNASMTEV